MRALVLFFLLSFSVSGKEIIVQDKNREYSLSYDTVSVRYKDRLTSLSLQAQPCNEHILKRMVQKLDHHFNRPFLDSPRPEFLKLRIDGKEVYEPRFGKRSRFLLSMNQEIKKLKIEEDLNCNKN